MSQLHLVTGFPGFIGRRLVKALLARDGDARVFALVQDSMRRTADETAAAIDPGGERIEVVPGDITDGRLGLDDETYERLTDEVRVVFHLAAVYDLAVPLEVATRVNVDGTGNIVDFTRRAKQLERHAYVSTAYVAGLRTGIVYEHELVMGQGFKNHYESTKFQAEVWVREHMRDVPTTILRPAIVVGDANTGETEKFDGPYYILRALQRSRKMHVPMPQFGRAAAKFNVVPVDYVVDAMVAAAFDEHTTGETLHLVDPDPLSSGELISLLSELYLDQPPKGRVPAALIEHGLRFKRMRRLYGGTPRESIAYLNHPVVYDARRTVDLLRPHGLVPPKFPEYARTMVDFFREHEDDPKYVKQ